MTLKNTILTSAATCLVVHLLLWMLGWLVWPLIWLGLGYASLKVWAWTMKQEFSNPTPFDFGEKFFSIICGPIMGIVAFSCDGHRYVKWLPKIRNPFVWPEKHD